MFRFIIRWLATTLGIGAAGYILPGIQVDGVHLSGFGSAVLGAIVISLVAGLVNWALRPTA